MANFWQYLTSVVLQTEPDKSLLFSIVSFQPFLSDDKDDFFLWNMLNNKMQCRILRSESVTLLWHILFQQLHLMTRAVTTRPSMQPTASNLSLDKNQSDVIREISPLVGIASMVLLVTYRCPLHVHLCVVVVPMPQDGSKDNILLLQMVKWLVKFVIIGQTIAVGGKTTLKSRTAAPFTCMSCKKRLYARLDIVVSIDALKKRDAIDSIAVISGLTSKRIEI